MIFGFGWGVGSAGSAGLGGQRNLLRNLLPEAVVRYERKIGLGP